MNTALARSTLLGVFLAATGPLAQGAPTGSTPGPTGSTQAPTGSTPLPADLPPQPQPADQPPPPAYPPPPPAYPPPQPTYAAPYPAPPPPPAPGLVRQNAVGPRFAIIPGIFIPSSGSAGFSLGLEGGYGLDLGPVIVTPGLAFQGNWGGDFTAYTGLAIARVTLPLGPFGPFIEGGLGYGHVSGPLDYSSGNLAWRAGAGFIFFFTARFAIGLDVRYDAIVDTPFKGWTFAPLILLSF
jgi:hypothetical protein